MPEDITDNVVRDYHLYHLEGLNHHAVILNYEPPIARGSEVVFRGYTWTVDSKNGNFLRLVKPSIVKLS